MPRTLLLSGILILTLFSCTPDPEVDTDLWAAVPPTAVAVGITHDLPALSDRMINGKFFAEIKDLPFVAEQFRRIEDIAGLYPQDSIYKHFSGKPFLISAHVSGAGKYDLLFLAPANRMHWSGWKQKLDGRYSLETLAYAEHEISVFKIDEVSLYATVHNGILALSFSRLPVEQALRQMDSQVKITSSAAFAKLMSTANPKEPLNLFVNMGSLPEALRYLFPGIQADALVHTTTWCEVDLDLGEDRAVLSGIALAADSSNSWLANFKELKPVSLSVPPGLPARTAAWISMGCQSAEQWHRRYARHLGKRNTDQALQRLKRDFSNELDLFLSALDQEWGAFYTETAEGQSSAHHLGYLQLRDGGEDQLMILSDSAFIEGYREHIIRKLNIPDLLPLTFGRVFRGFKEPYYTVHEGVAYFSSEPEALKGIINDFWSEQLLEGRSGYTQLADQVGKQGHLWTGFQNPEYLSWLKEWSGKENDRLLEQHRDGLGHIRFGALLLQQEGDVCFINGMLAHSTDKAPETQQIWATRLEAPLLGRPQWVINHYTKKKEIVVQDRNHSLYLLDAKGEILWKRPLDGPILGEIHQVDLFRNNRLQMAFVTARKLYILDRNGQEVAPFPLTLKTDATGGLAVFDYDRSRNYRFVVPAGGRLLNFDKEGKEVKGWKFKGTPGTIRVAPKHYLLAGKDLIPVLDDRGNLSIIDRRGELRLKKAIPTSLRPEEFYLVPGKSTAETALTGLTRSGKQLFVFLNGKQDSLELDQPTAPDHLIRFEGRTIVADRNTLSIKDERNPFTRELEEGLVLAPQAFVFHNRFYVGITQPEAERVSIFNAQGEPLPGSPLYGSSAFVAGDLQLRGNLNLVVGTEDGTLICYKLE